MWPLVWGKAYYDRLVSDANDRAFENVTPNDHTEVMANDARLTAQQEVFGTQDEYGNRVMAGPFLCMAYELSDSALDLGDAYDFDGIANDLHPDENVGSVEDVCAEGILSPDGELPEMPTIEEIILSPIGVGVPKLFAGSISSGAHSSPVSTSYPYIRGPSVGPYTVPS